MGCGGLDAPSRRRAPAGLLALLLLRLRGRPHRVVVVQEDRGDHDRSTHGKPAGQAGTIESELERRKIADVDLLFLDSTGLMWPFVFVFTGVSAFYGFLAY